MKSVTKNIGYLSLFIVVLFFSCSKKELGVPILKGTINVNTTFTKNNIYVIEGVTTFDSTLNIEAGAIIKFKPGAWIIAKKINAIGTKDSPITFTSIKDDLKNDTNGDSNKSTPQAGDWKDIVVHENSLFNYCVFQYGGREGSVLSLAYTKSTVSDCTFANNDYDNSAFSSEIRGTLVATEPGTIIKNNIFYNNVMPLSIASGVDIDDSNQFSNPENSNQKNKYNGILVQFYGYLESDVVWEETEVAFVIGNVPGGISPGVSITLKDNVVLKFLDNSTFYVHPEAQIINHDAPGVYFTSFRDDSKKGDTNGDGIVVLDGSDYWNGIKIDDGSIYNYYDWDNILYD